MVVAQGGSEFAGWWCNTYKQEKYFFEGLVGVLADVWNFAPAMPAITSISYNTSFNTMQLPTTARLHVLLRTNNYIIIDALCNACGMCTVNKGTFAFLDNLTITYPSIPLLHVPMFWFNCPSLCPISLLSYIQNYPPTSSLLNLGRVAAFCGLHLFYFEV